MHTHTVSSWGILILFFAASCNQSDSVTIDRYAMVKRHIPENTTVDGLSPFTVGNGDFAFTADVTGLQTFDDPYAKGIPLATLSNWGWNALPNENGYTTEQTFEYYDTYGRQVPYSVMEYADAASYLRSNPHRFNLGRIGFKKSASSFQPLDTSDISDIHQTLDIWEGIIKSKVTVNSQPVEVKTCVHPQVDAIAASISAPDLKQAGLSIGFEFPYGSTEWGKDASNWNSPEKHTSEVIEQHKNRVVIKRILDEIIYYATIQWEGQGAFSKTEDHFFLLEITDKNAFSFSCSFSQTKKTDRETVTAIMEQAKAYWQKFWNSGGAVDLSGSTHPMADELERRIVLSQYLTAIQCSGDVPPQETGLTINSWYGRFHLEMHWWHVVHFALWGREEMLQRSMPWYDSIMPMARQKARRQGYSGVRWPKMAVPDGTDCPSSIANFLIWQQPHPIYFAELLYRLNPLDTILKRYKEIVFQSAEFMVSYAHWDEANNRYVLGPPLIPAQEIYSPEGTMNPPFELSYWQFGLETALKWKERLGLDPVEHWQHVVNHLSELPHNKGVYQNAETVMNTFQDAFHRHDHPAVLAAYGMIPNDSIDKAMMERTLEKVVETWNWSHTWGWDYPMVAMNASRLGRPVLAIKALLMDVQKNTYLNNGHNYQDDRLPIYLPGNGGLLTAIAMMTAGWEGAPDSIQAPGFPDDGQWEVKYEGLNKLP